MVFVPERSTIVVTVGASRLLGCSDAKIVSKRTQKEITIDDDASVRRTGLLKDADLSLTCKYSNTDVGQQAIITSNDNNTQVQYTIVKGSLTFVATAGVEQLSFPGGPGDEQTMEVTLAVSLGIAITHA